VHEDFPNAPALGKRAKSSLSQIFFKQESAAAARAAGPRGA